MVLQTAAGRNYFTGSIPQTGLPPAGKNMHKKHHRNKIHLK